MLARSIILLFAFLMTGNLFAQPGFNLNSYATGFDRITDIAHAGDGRLFVVEQDGRIKIIDETGTPETTTFLDIDALVGYTANERGLLGMAFHPDYATNGYFYVNYTDNSGDTKVSRFSVTADPDIADPLSEFVILAADQPDWNHNGGGLKFASDGYLYISLGDGGGGNDTYDNGQNPNTLLAKILRIDVDGGSPYAIPGDNPYVGDPSVIDETWVWGLRNPWRFSFDRLNGDMWIADVGQNQWEEIDYLPASSSAGENYGWPCYEGNNSYLTSGCGPSSSYEFPVHEYSHSGGRCSVTGGFVSRDEEQPDLWGHYLYADYCTGEFWSLYPDGIGGFTNTFLFDGINFDFSTFGEGNNGELYVAELDGGEVFRIEGDCPGFNLEYAVSNTSGPGAGDGSIDLVINNGNPIFEIVWSTGAISEDVSGLMAGTYTVTVTDAAGCELTESILVEDGGCTVSSLVSGLVAVPAPNGTNVNLNWDALNGADLYQAKGRRLGTIPFGQFVTANTTKNVGGLIPSTDYEWKVRARCEGTAEVTAFTGLSQFTTATPTGKFQLATEVKLNIYPNPASDVLQVSINGMGVNSEKLLLTDITGRILMSLDLDPDASFQVLEFDVSELSNGVYIVSPDNGSMNTRCTIMH